MARILHDDEWFDELGQGSLYEIEYERIFQQRVPVMYPGFIAVRFKKTVYSEDGSARADLALIQRDYLAWWVVEIEKASHSTLGHVLPQVRTLANASYGREEATYLHNQSDCLEGSRLVDMIRGEPPRVLVVVDMPRDDWRAPLEEHRAKLSVFQLYRSHRGRYITRLNGYHPTVSPVLRSLCKMDPTFYNLLMVQNPAILPSGLDNTVSVYFQGRLTSWQRIETGDTVWLQPRARVDLDENQTYEILLEANKLILQTA